MLPPKRSRRGGGILIWSSVRESYRGRMMVASRSMASPLNGWRARAALRAARRRADHELLASRVPSPRHAWRVEELVGDASRTAAGRSLAEIAHTADGRWRPSASRSNRPAVRASRAQLLDLAARICDLGRPVAPRGVLLVERLLTDRSSALYRRVDEGSLLQQIKEARPALEAIAH